MAEPYLRIAVVHDDGSSAVYHVREIRLEAVTFQVKAERYVMTITPLPKSEG